MLDRVVIEFPEDVVVVPGPHGQGLHFVSSSDVLTADYGREGDAAFIRDTGQEWVKTNGVWTATDEQFLNGFLPAVVAARDAAIEARDTAVARALQTGQDVLATGADRDATGEDRQQTGEDRVATGLDREASASSMVLAARWAQEAPDTPVDGGYSAFHWATKAEYWASRPILLTIEANIGDISAVAAAIGAVSTLAAIDEELLALYGSLGNLNTVAASIAAVDLAALNMAAIVAAPAWAADAMTYRDQALGSKDEGLAAALLSQGYAANAAVTKAQMDVALANVTNYDNTLGQLKGDGKRALVATDVARSIVYDAGTDSDGGKWRWRQRGSTFVEQLGVGARGTRNFFPKLAHLVGQPATLTVLDGDDIAAPLWKSWTVAGLTSVAALQGFILYAGTGGAYIIDLLGDAVYRHSTAGWAKANQNVASYNQGTATWSVLDAGKAIVNNTVHAVAATVRPGIPVDPVRRLPNPTIAVGTAGGVSVIQSDGKVTNSTTTNAAASVAFGADGVLWQSLSQNTGICYSTPAEYALTNFATRLYSTGSTPTLPGGNGKPICPIPGGFAAGSTNGLTLLRHTPGSGIGSSTTANRSSVAYIARDFNTGWMTGNTLYCGAESTRDQTNLVGLVLSDDFSSYADTAAVIAAGWNKRAGVSGSVALVAGEFQYSRDAGEVGGVAAGRIVSGFVVGVKYRIRGKIRVVSGGGTAFIAMRTSDGGGGTNLVNSSTVSDSDPTPVTILWTADAASRHLAVHASNNGATVALDDVVIERLAEDRSAAGNQPTIVGTVQRQAFAAGCELVGYRPSTSGAGFENAALAAALAAIGTGDLTIDLIIAGDNSGSTQQLLQLRDSGDTNNLINFFRATSSGTAALGIVIGGSNLSTMTGFKDGVARPVTIVRRSGVVGVWVSGALEASGAGAGSLAGAAAVLHMLKSSANTNAATDCLAGQIKVEAGARTPAQIREAHAAHAAMPLAGAKILLTGSGSVNRPGHDKGTGSLYVPQTTGGTDVFIGLCRIATRNMASVGAAMTSDNHKSVVAENDNVAFITANEVYVETPTIGLREALTRKDAEHAYDRNVVKLPSAGVTTSALSTVIARLPMGKDEAGDWTIRTTGLEWGDPASPAFGDFEDKVHAYRPGEGNIVVGTSVQRVVQRSVGTIAVTISANTTAQTIDVAVVGENPKNIEWGVTATFSPTKEQVAA
jgi:hypothetical protein